MLPRMTSGTGDKVNGQVVPFTKTSLPATSAPETLQLQVRAWIASWHDEPAYLIPATEAERAASVLPEVIRAAEAKLEPGDPAEVLAMLQVLATRRGLPLPDGLALDLDVEMMAAWPKDLFTKAFRGVWETFAYRRFPEVPDFHKHIASDIRDRREEVAKLRAMQRKLAVRAELAASHHREDELRQAKVASKDRRGGGFALLGKLIPPDEVLIVAAAR